MKLNIDIEKKLIYIKEPMSLYCLYDEIVLRFGGDALLFDVVADSEVLNELDDIEDEADIHILRKDYNTSTT